MSGHRDDEELTGFEFVAMCVVSVCVVFIVVILLVITVAVWFGK